MVLSGVRRKKSPVTLPGIDPGTVRLAAQHLNHYATPGPHFKTSALQNYRVHTEAVTNNSQPLRTTKI